MLKYLTKVANRSGLDSHIRNNVYYGKNLGALAGALGAGLAGALGGGAAGFKYLDDPELAKRIYAYADGLTGGLVSDIKLPGL
jgi:hypothetical protein